MRLVIRGHHLPGGSCGPYDGVHVGLQVGREPEGLVPGDSDSTEWVTELHTDGGDFHGRAVQGRRGEEVTVDVDLTDDAGMPRCARLPAAALRIS